MVTPRSVGLLGAGVIGGGWAARLRAGRRRRAPVRPRRRRPPRPPSTPLERARRAWRRLTLAPLPAEGTLTLAGLRRGGGRGRRARAGERPRARGAQARAAGAGERGGAARRDHRHLDLGAAADPAGRRDGAPRALRGRPSLQPGLPAAAGGGVRRRSAPRPRRWQRAAAMYRVARHAPADRPPRDRRLHRRPAAGGAVARGAVAGRRRRRDRRGDRRRHPLRRRAALGGDGHVPDLPPRRRRRPACATSWPSSDRRCSCRGPSSPTCPSSTTSCWTSSWPSQTPRPAVARSPSSPASATIAWSRCCAVSRARASPPARWWR